MSTMRFDKDRWQKLTDRELKLTIKAGKIVRKSQMINHLIDNYLRYIDYQDGEVVFKMEPKK